MPGRSEGFRWASPQPPLHRRQVTRLSVAVLAAVMSVPPHLQAQSSAPREEMTAEIAEHALAPGTTLDAAKAWLEYWDQGYAYYSVDRFAPLFQGVPTPAGTASVLTSRSRYIYSDAVSGSWIEIYIYLTADNRVLKT